MPTRAQLVEEAELLGIEVKASDTKSDIAARIEAAETAPESEPSVEDEPVEAAPEEPEVEESDPAAPPPEMRSSGVICANCDRDAEWETISRTSSKIAVCSVHKQRLAEPVARLNG